MQVELLYKPGSTIAQCRIQQGETPIRAEAGAMIGMSPNMKMETASGGLMKGLKSMLGGESFFTNTFTSTGGVAELLVAPSLPGDLGVLSIDSAAGAAGEWHIQRGAFVACDNTVEIESKSGGFKGLMSGSGLLQLKAKGQGVCLVGAFGALEEVEVSGSYVVDTGHLVAWQGSLEYKVTKAGGGFVAALMSGEGFVCTFQGTGKLWIQTRNAQAYGQLVGGMLPPA